MKIQDYKEGTIKLSEFSKWSKDQRFVKEVYCRMFNYKTQCIDMVPLEFAIKPNLFESLDEIKKGLYKVFN